jgi:hypothetical protein
MLDYNEYQSAAACIRPLYHPHHTSTAHRCERVCVIIIVVRIHRQIIYARQQTKNNNIFYYCNFSGEEEKRWEKEKTIILIEIIKQN